MGGEKERAELAAFEALLSKCIADALVAQVRKEAEAHGVDVPTGLALGRTKEQIQLAQARTVRTNAFTPRRQN